MADRPMSFESFNGQADVVANLAMAVRSAKARNKLLGHILFAGPAGCGKTTLAASVLPKEMGCTVRSVNCASIEKATDMSLLLTQTPADCILFLDELHALPPPAREHLLTALEDGKLSVKVGESLQSKVIEVALPPFTVIGATTRMGVLDGPLRTRFKYTFTLQPYDDESMAKIIDWHAEQHNMAIDPFPLVRPAHGIARRAVNLVEACIDTYFGTGLHERYAGKPTLHAGLIEDTLARLGYRGQFDEREFRYLSFLAKCERGAGLNTIASVLDETQATIEEIYEPWLLQQGYVIKASSGRTISDSGKAAIEAAQDKQ